jgi:hypothetical protein
VSYPTAAGGLLGHWLVLLGFSTIFLVVAGLALRQDESI